MTPAQRAVQLYNFKEKQKKDTGNELSNQEVADQFQANAPMTAASGDQMCKSYVDSALGVYTRVPIHTECNDMVLKMANLKGKKTPYDSMYKLEVYPRKANDNLPLMIWCMRYTNEIIIEEVVGAGELTFNNLTGK